MQLTWTNVPCGRHVRFQKIAGFKSSSHDAGEQMECQSERHYRWRMAVQRILFWLAAGTHNQQKANKAPILFFGHRIKLRCWHPLAHRLQLYTLCALAIILQCISLTFEVRFLLASCAPTGNCIHVLKANHQNKKVSNCLPSIQNSPNVRWCLLLSLGYHWVTRLASFGLE